MSTLLSAEGRQRHFRMYNTMNLEAGGPLNGKWTGSFRALKALLHNLPHSHEHFFLCSFCLTFTHIHTSMDASENNLPKDIWHTDWSR